MSFNVRVCFSCISIILNATSCVLGFFFLFVSLSFTSSVLQTRAATAICCRPEGPKRREGKQTQEKREERLHDWSQMLPAERLCVFCLVMNSQPSASSWLFFWIRTALFGPDWAPPPPPPSLPPWETRAPCSSAFSLFFPQNTAAEKQPDLQTATVFAANV